MRKIFIQGPVIFAFLLVGFSCVAPDPKDNTILYGNGLTGEWTANIGSNHTFTIVNKTGSTIDGFKYAIQPLEPTDWASAATVSLGIPMANNGAQLYTIGNGGGSNVNIGAAFTVTIWIKVTVGSNYLVGSFDYNDSIPATTMWGLTVWAKS